MATRPNNQPLIASNGTGANQPTPHCLQRHWDQSTNPSLPGPNNCLLIATNGTPIESFGIRQIELQLGPSNRLLFATIGTPIKSFGTHQIELQLGPASSRPNPTSKSQSRPLTTQTVPDRLSPAISQPNLKPFSSYQPDWGEVCSDLRIVLLIRSANVYIPENIPEDHNTKPC